MRHSRFATLAVALIGLVSASPSPAKAAILDTILSTVQQANNRAAAARDRAIEARNSADEIRDRVREGVTVLTDQLRTMIDEAVEDVTRIVAEEMAGRDAFLGESGCSAKLCEPFRQDMLTLLNDIQSITNCLFAITELDQVDIDISREIGIVEDLPGRALFPLYRVLSGESNMFKDGLLPRLSQLAADLLELKSLVLDTACGPVWDDPDRAITIMRQVTLATSTLQLVGKTMISVGETELFGDAGVHGYAHVNVRLNSLKKWGGRLVGLSDTILPVIQFAGRKVDYCIELQKDNENQTELVQGQQEIMMAIKSLSCASPGGAADLNLDGVVNLEDYALFQMSFGSAN